MVTLQQPYDQATHAFAEDGQVILDGPDGVAVSLTPDAAEKSSRNIAAAAREARRQCADRDN